MTNLTEGACLLHTPTPDFPVVQVLSIQKLPNSHLQRHRLVVSDGVHFRSALLAIHLNQFIQSQEISALCLIQMKDFVLTIDQAEGTEQATSLLLFLNIFSYFYIVFYFILQRFFYCRCCCCRKTTRSRWQSTKDIFCKQQHRKNRMFEMPINKHHKNWMWTLFLL